MFYLSMWAGPALIRKEEKKEDFAGNMMGYQGCIKGK